MGRRTVPGERTPVKTFSAGDIAMVALDPTIGREQKGRRPVLVLTDGSYNRITGVPIVAAITNGGIFARDNGFSVSLMGVGLLTTGVVRCDQIRSLDLSNRSADFVETVPEFILDEVREIVGTILEIH